jgi:hypothetical protein
MKNLAHSILRLSNSVANNVEKFEKLIEKFNIRDYVVSDYNFHIRLFDSFGYLAY